MDDTYLLLKTIHVVGAVIFLGNIIVTGWWKNMADRTRDPKVIAFAQRQVTLTDFIFTAGGVVLMLGGGLGNAYLYYGGPIALNWVAWGFALFTISGLIWLAILIPVQARQARMARAFAAGADIPAAYWRLCRWWNIWGTLATALPLAAVYWMVYKPV